MRGQRHAPAAFYPRERPGTHYTGGWVGPRAGLDGGKSRPTGIRSPDPPAHSQSLYRLSYLAHDAYGGKNKCYKTELEKGKISGLGGRVLRLKEEE